MRLFHKSLIGIVPPASKGTNPFLTLSHTPLREERNIFSLKNREEEGYLQNLLDNGKDCKILPVFRVPSIGPTTGIQQALKALHR
jgi:hypothetical protein